MPAVPPAPTRELGTFFRKWIEQLRQIIGTVPDFSTGEGSPEGVLTADQGARYFRTDGTAGTFMYVKTTNGGNTGWLAYA